MSAECGQRLVEVREVNEKGNEVAGRLSIHFGEEKALGFNDNPQNEHLEGRRCNLQSDACCL